MEPLNALIYTTKKLEVIKVFYVAIPGDSLHGSCLQVW